MPPLMQRGMIKTPDAASHPQMDSPGQSGWPKAKLHFSPPPCHIKYQFQMVNRGRNITIVLTKITIVSKSQSIQTACLDRWGLLLPLLLSVMSALSYLSAWQGPGADAPQVTSSQAKAQFPVHVTSILLSQHLPEFRTLLSQVNLQQQASELSVDVEHKWQSCSASHWYLQVLWNYASIFIVILFL